MGTAAAGLQNKPESSDPPTKITRRASRRWSIRALIVLNVVACAVVAVLLAGWTPVRSLELKTYDWRYRLLGRRAAPTNIILVLLDQKTEHALPEPRMFWQPHLARVIRTASGSGARAIGLDLFFAAPVDRWEPDADRELAAAFAEVLPRTPLVASFQTMDGPAATVPLYMFASAFGALGYANLTVDADNVVRRHQPVEDGPAGQQSFAARLVAAQHAGADASRHSSGRPLYESKQPLLIRYFGPGGTFRSISMIDVLTAAEKNDRTRLASWFDGNTVLIGTLDAADRHTTPYFGLGDQWATPGVEIQASIVATLTANERMREAGGAWLALLSLAGAALAAAAVVWLGFPAGPAALGAAAVAFFFLAARAQAAGLVLPIAAPLLATAGSALGSYGIYARTEGRQRRVLQDVFGRYVSDEIAREVLHAGEVPLGGARLEITVMFSDLRNYTSHCQVNEAEVVVQELNEYFADMTEAIKQHGGMVNKFIGDGIMAIFGAPIAHVDHAARAIRAGLDMVRRNERFNERRAARGQAPLIIGIGLHTGDAVVGTVGAPEKLEYTAIGDTVNIASRIEGENKTFGTRLLISAATRDRTREAFETRLAGEARLKGVTEPVNLYSVEETRNPL